MYILSTATNSSSTTASAYGAVTWMSTFSTACTYTMENTIKFCPKHVYSGASLTHSIYWDQEKMATIFQVTFSSHFQEKHVHIQTPQKLFMFYRTENQFFTTFSNFKHGYIKKFYWSSHIFHWSSHFFISRGPRTDKFRGVCIFYWWLH